jgi:hypothetical protein
MGETSREMSKHFKFVYTIEIDQKIYNNTKKLFKKYSNITPLLGDSGLVIEDLLTKIDKKETCIFWLDGHYSGGITGLGEKETPIKAELKHIYNHSNSHLIMIDDARMFFNNRKDYPLFEDLKDYIMTLNKDATIYIEDDIIFIH